MKRTTTLALAVAALSLLLASPAAAKRRVDAGRKAKQLMGQLAKAGASQADRIEEQIATLATDLLYMDDVEPVLIKGLKSKSVRQRRAAARLLRYTVSGAAVSPLATVVSKDRSADIRLEAVTSLCILKAEEAVGSLRAAGTGDRSAKVRAAATAALDVIEDRAGGRRAGCRRSLQRRLALLR